MIEFSRDIGEMLTFEQYAYHLCVKCTALREICLQLLVCRILFHLYSVIRNGCTYDVIFSQKLERLQDSKICVFPGIKKFFNVKSVHIFRRLIHHLVYICYSCALEPHN